MAKKESEHYEQLMAKVQGIISDLENSQLGLDEMVEKVEKGYNFIKDMQKRLSKTEKQVEKLRSQFEQDMQSEFEQE